MRHDWNSLINDKNDILMTSYSKVLNLIVIIFAFFISLKQESAALFKLRANFSNKNLLAGRSYKEYFDL